MFGLFKRLVHSAAKNVNSNVIGEEINKFSSVGNSWWVESSSAGTGPLHAMNRCRVGFIRQKLSHAATQIKNLKILDVGCGGGLLSESLARLGAQVTAIDASPIAIAVAKQHSETDPLTSNILYKNCVIDDLIDAGEQFDVVCSLEVLEHVQSPSTFVEKCVKCVKTNGSLFLSTINRTPKSYALAIVGAEYILGLVPQGTHDWSKFVTPAELQVMTSTAAKNSQRHCTGTDTQGMIVDMSEQCRASNPLRPQHFKLSSDDLDVNYIMHTVMTEHTQSNNM